ncbi:MAG: HNH/ENDO VII family nuclease [Treponema sp.]|nr:HNH/ENDO VII family nuclease [Treponema sp.]
MNRTALNATEKSQVAVSYNSKGQAVDPHTRQPLNMGKVDIGHRYGYEEKALQRCAERCHMTQKQYNQMVKENAKRLFHLEDRTQNRSHKHECKDFKTQNRKCMQLIREFKNKSNGKSKQSAKVRNSKSSPKVRTSKGKTIQGYQRISMNATGNKMGIKSGIVGSQGKNGSGGNGKIGGHSSKGGSIGGGKGVSTGGGAKGVSTGSGKGK